MTKGTASPLNSVFLNKNATRIPTIIPSRYKPVIISQEAFGKNAVTKKP